MRSQYCKANANMFTVHHQTAFEELGLFPGKQTIKMDPSVILANLKLRKVMAALQGTVKNTLNGTGGCQVIANDVPEPIC